MKRKKIYLATIYSTDSTPALRISRYEAVNKVAAKLMGKGYLVFSPISHTHPIALVGDLSVGWDFWKDFDYAFIDWCDEVYVFMQKGWEYSVGVHAEKLIALELKKPIKYLPNDYAG